jgi:hypothetical protein
MTYEQIKDFKPDDCKRACGVHPQTFAKMLHVLQENVQKKIKPDVLQSSRWRISSA